MDTILQFYFRVGSMDFQDLVVCLTNLLMEMTVNSVHSYFEHNTSFIHQSPAPQKNQKAKYHTVFILFKQFRAHPNINFYLEFLNFSVHVKIIKRIKIVVKKRLVLLLTKFYRKMLNELWEF